jgi:hypothetical protein
LEDRRPKDKGRISSDLKIPLPQAGEQEVSGKCPRGCIARPRTDIIINSARIKRFRDNLHEQRRPLLA